MQRAGEHAVCAVRRAPWPWPRRARWGGAIFAVLVTAPLTLLLFADWNVMRGPIARAASGVMTREVTIAGDLDVDPCSAEPLIVADGVRVANPAWAGAGDTITLKRVRARVAWLPLLIGRVRVTTLDLDSPQFLFQREKSGRATWSFGEGDQGRRPLNIPPIRQFQLNDGALRIVDHKRNIVLDAQIKSDDGGKSVATPIAFSLPHGEIAAAARLDATRDPPEVDVDLRVTNARVEDFMACSKQPGAITGLLAARAKLHGRGRSLHQSASTADGQVSLVVPRGEIRRAFAELLGVNVTKGLGLLLTHDTEKTDIRCAVADFRARDGLLSAESVVFDPGVVVASGGGTVNLGTEALNLKLQGRPKEARLIRIKAPVEITSHLRSPHLGVDLSKAGARAGIGGALAAQLTPVAAILPFVNPGLAEGANCAQLVADARRS